MSRIRVKPCGGIEVSEVKRYDPDDSIDLYEVADGEWVLHSDYATLSAELAQSRAREARLVALLRDAVKWTAGWARYSGLGKVSMVSNDACNFDLDAARELIGP